MSWIVFDRSGEPLTLNFPFDHSRSSGLASSRWAAIWRDFSRILRAATAVAAPAHRRGAGGRSSRSPYGAVSVSPYSILTMSETGNPSSSAMIWAKVVSWPWPWVWTPTASSTLPVGWTRISLRIEHLDAPGCRSRATARRPRSR